jgi:ribonuclease VapC
MVVDPSALLAIVFGEDERDKFEELILWSPTVVMSVVSVVETTIAVAKRRSDLDPARLDAMLNVLRIEVQAVDIDQGLLARQAFLQYGRGRHPARLNFGDCFSYALAKSRNDSLLFKGDDFSKTDLVPAWQP